jgi:hypothetical protein
VDDYTSYFWSYYDQRKDEIANKLVDLINELRNEKIYVVLLRLDDAIENYALEKAFRQENLKVKIENFQI